MCRMELQRVKSRLYRILRRNTELFDNLMDTLNADGVRRLYYIRLIKELFRNKSAMPDLYGSLSSLYSPR